MIFINCHNESIVQVNDMTRIDVSRSFVSTAPITDITIKPEASASAVSVFNANQDLWFLDWAYGTSGVKTITVEATDGVSTVSQNFSLVALSKADDNLYSSDSDIFAMETELKKYLPEGRNSYNYVHREAQSRILNYLDRKRIWNNDGTPLGKAQINKTGEIRLWSTYEALYMIYTDLFVSVGDKFAEKVNQYKELRAVERDRASIRIDRDSSGEIDPGEIQDLKSYRMLRR